MTDYFSAAPRGGATKAPLHFAGTDGPPWPSGPPGISVQESGVIFREPEHTNLWTIPHNLGAFPEVSVQVDAGGQQLGGSVTHIDVNTVLLKFSAPVAGYARLNIDPSYEGETPTAIPAP